MNDSNSGVSHTDPWLLDSSCDECIDEIEMKFSDNFEPKLNENQSKLCSENTFNSLEDSQRYLKSLEKKLSKLKGNTNSMSSKDVLNSLSTKKNAIIERLLRYSSDCHNYWLDSDTDYSTPYNERTLYSIVERLLCPQNQALTTEELSRLLDSDVLEKVTNDSTHSDHYISQ